MNPRWSSPAARCIAAVLGSMILVGCGGGAPHHESGSGHPTPARVPAAARGGSALFRYQCGSCHTIGDSNTTHQGSGGDVLTYRLDRRQMLEFTREMPEIHGPRSEDQIQAIVNYLQQLARSGVR